MRIDKYLSEMGVATRRDAAREAKRGNITVNGVCVKDSGAHITPGEDVLMFCGKEIAYSRFVYVMLNKPDGYVSATDDKSLPYVLELLPRELKKRELFPVGRLDRDTVGLMILTDDGAAAHYLLSPKHHVEKEYYFKCIEPLCPEAEEIFRTGAVLADGYECKSAVLKADEDRMGGIITLTEGKYHQIKRMLGSINNKVVFLKRIKFAGILLDNTLAVGEWKYLTEDEEKILLASVPKDKK